VRWLEKDGEFKGCGWIDFSESDATDKALELYKQGKVTHASIQRPITVDYGTPRRQR
jgi:hypothetical protein